MITTKEKVVLIRPHSFVVGGQILSAGAIADLHELIQENPELFLDELRLWLAIS